MTRPRYPRLFGRGVLLAATEPAPTEDTPAAKNPRWLQIAYAGDFVYRGKPITFDRDLFETIVRNFRANPAYAAAPGQANVVHFDYEHASELDPREGSIPSGGAPAPAWVQELDIREGDDGLSQLWAFAKFGPRALQQITTDPPEYQWTSVAIATSYADPVTGEDRGPTLTSVALTNDPFLQGMVPISIAASQLGYDQTDDAARAATPAEIRTMTLSTRLAALFRVNEHDETILAAAEKVVAAQDAMDTLLGILGAADFQSALAAAKAMVEKTSGMGEIVAQLAAAMERLGQVDQQDAEMEAEAVVASRVAMMGLAGNAARVAADSLRPAVLAMRKACIDRDASAQERKLAEFRKVYPLPDADRALLTRRIFAGTNGVQFGLRADDAGNLHPAPVTQPVTTPTTGRADGRSVTKIAMCKDYEGRNDVERAVAYLAKERPGFDKLDRMAQVKRAGEWLRSN